jgi:hypothetical protein
MSSQWCFINCIGYIALNDKMIMNLEGYESGYGNGYGLYIVCIDWGKPY